MIRLDLCHGASVDRLAGYISEFRLVVVVVVSCCYPCCRSFSLLFVWCCVFCDVGSAVSVKTMLTMLNNDTTVLSTQCPQKVRVHC